MYHPGIVPIGVTGDHPECKVCSEFEPWYRNRFTMDLLLSRPGLLSICNEDRYYCAECPLEDFLIHFEHCDANAVPDDYIFHPDDYELGETLPERAMEV